MGSECIDEHVRKLDEVVRQQYPSAKACLQDINAELSIKITEQTFSKIRRKKLRMPEEVRRWVTYRYSFGTVFVELRETDNALLRALRYVMEREDHEALIQLATTLIDAAESRMGSGLADPLLPRFYAFRSVGHSANGATHNACEDFKLAARHAKVVSPDLYPRYFISACVWESHGVDQKIKRRSISKDKWEEKLRGITDAVKKTVPSLDADKALRLRLLMRNASRLDDKADFVKLLNEARRCSGFGDTPEKIDKELKTWMSEVRDLDGDFRNARSYQQYSDL